MRAAKLLIKCLEAEGVEYMFGIPGEENIDVMDALLDSPIKFILVRHEQAASLMASTYGHYAGKPGVCLATLGPGAINLILGAAAAFQDYSPLVAITGQRGTSTLFQESHQVLDLVSLFRPVTKWCQEIDVPSEIPGYVRKAFKIAGSDRFGSTMLVLPEDIAGAGVPDDSEPITPHGQSAGAPVPALIEQAAKLIASAQNPIVLAGSGIVRSRAEDSLRRFADATGMAVLDMFSSRGALDNRHRCYVAPLGFMTRDYANIVMERADTIVAVGYDFIEYPPENFKGRPKRIINISTTGYETDAKFNPEVNITADIGLSLDALTGRLPAPVNNYTRFGDINGLWRQELKRFDAVEFTGAIKPEKIIAEMRAVLGDDDVLICDTGALKMWIARLFPVYRADSFFLSNGLATMSLALPGAMGAKLAMPEKHVVAVMGDGSFLMNSQELETARRCGIPFVIFVWCDDTYGLIKWRQDLKFGRPSHIAFKNPDFRKYAESFGVKSYHITRSSEIAPMLREAIGLDEVVLVYCDVDYSDNVALVNRLAGMTI